MLVQYRRPRKEVDQENNTDSRVAQEIRKLKQENWFRLVAQCFV